MFRDPHGPKHRLYGRTSGFPAGILGDWASIPHPGRESFLQTWQRHTLETRVIPGSAAPWGWWAWERRADRLKCPGQNARAGRGRGTWGPGRRPDRDSGPGSRAALSLPQRAEAQPRGSGAGLSLDFPGPPLHTPAFVAAGGHLASATWWHPGPAPDAHTRSARGLVGRRRPLVPGQGLGQSLLAWIPAAFGPLQWKAYSLMNPPACAGTGNRGQRGPFLLKGSGTIGPKFGILNT